METQKQDTMRETDFPNRRRPWTAVFLSLIGPGLGQIYCGSIILGFTLFALATVFYSFWIVGIMHDRTPKVLFSLIIWSVLLFIQIFAPIDAYRRARRTRYDYILKDYNHWALYFLMILIGGVGCIGYVFNVKGIAGNFRVNSNSMAPTIMDGNKVFSNNMAYHHENPEYGDVALFKYPGNRRGNRIKRVVALGGDTVEIKDGQLLVNGKVLKREQIGTKTIRMGANEVEGTAFWEHCGNARYKIFVSERKIENQTQEKDFGPVTVPKFHCFVMGDNRNHSEDSRQFGSLSYGALKGRLARIYWPLSRMASLDAQE